MVNDGTVDLGQILFNVIPLIILFGLLTFFLIRTRKVTVYLISAVKPDVSDIVEMHVSTNKSDIDEWEKTFWNRGYRVSRKTDDVEVKSQIRYRGF